MLAVQALSDASSEIVRKKRSRNGIQPGTTHEPRHTVQQNWGERRFSYISRNLHSHTKRVGLRQIAGVQRGPFDGSDRARFVEPLR